MKRRPKIIIISVLAIALIVVAIAAIRPFRDTASSPAPVSDEGTAAAEPEGTQSPDAAKSPVADQTASRKVSEINIYAEYADSDLYRMIEAYVRKHWGYLCKINFIDSSTYYSENEIRAMINQSLQSGDGAVDIYLIDDGYAPYYLRGEYSQYACTYKELGIDVESELKKAEIPEFVVGRNSEGEVIAIPYQSGACVFLYRRSIAREVWGTDDPESISEIIGGGSQSWDKFLEAAKDLKKHGYYIAPGFEHLSYMLDTSSYPLWDSDRIEIPPLWENYMDISKYLLENAYIADFDTWWYDSWHNDLEGPGSKVFGTVVHPDSLDFNIGEETSGDWAVCIPPFTPWHNGHIGIMVNKASPNRDVLGPLVEWITLDCSEEGAQYGLATGDLLGREVSVLSGTVLKSVESRRDVLGGQDVNPIIYDLMNQPRGRHSGFSVFSFWLHATEAYLNGEMDKESAIRQAKSEIEKYGGFYEPYSEPPVGPESPEDKVVVWKDKNLEATVREVLFAPTRDIYESELSKITCLRLNDRSIESLEDIVHFKNLRALYLKSCNIEDISCLKGLTKLKVLDISDNGITDISALSGLTELEELYMTHNKVNDISSLEGLPALEHLEISRNAISDIGSLQGKPNLKYLDASRNNISNISSLSGLTNLEHLKLSDNKIVDISPLKNLTKLSYLDLEYNDICDISSLKGMKDLETLLLNGNRISDISSLKSLKKLKELRLAGSDIADKSPADHVESVTW